MDGDAALALAAEAVRLEISLFDQDAAIDTHARTYRLLRGRVPVAVSAPHAVQQPRLSSRDGRALHRSEPYTGPLAIQLHRATGAWAIYATRTSRADPNHAAVSTYKRYGLRELVARAAPRLIVDLHGAQTRDFAVAIGTSPLLRAGRAQNLIDRLAACLDAALEGRVCLDPPAFQANNPHTVAAFCWAQYGIPTVQLEICRTYRSARQNPRHYAALFAALRAYIGEVAALPCGVDNAPAG